MFSVQSEEFKDGVKRLQKLLEVPDIHPDHLVGLEACCKIIQSRLNQKSLRNPGKAAPKVEIAVACRLVTYYFLDGTNVCVLFI